MNEFVYSDVCNMLCTKTSGSVTKWEHCAVIVLMLTETTTERVNSAHI